MLTVRSIINIASQTVPPIIPVVQGDTGRAILFTLADFTIPAGATATYYVQKPSGEAVYNNATIDGNNVLVNLTAQSIIEKGDNYGQVRIAVGEDVVTSFDFILLVKEFRGIDAVQSLTEMNIFDKAVEQAADAIDEVKTDALEAIDDAKDEAIEEVTSNFDLKLDASSTKGVQNQVITQAINTVNNAIGDLSGETITPTATNNYGIGGSVGQVIETWATTDYWHGIYAVTAGNRYAIQTVSDYPQQIVVWFTNSSNVILEIHKAFATDPVEMVCTAPTGATKLFVMSYGYDAYHGTVQKVEPLSETVSNLKEDLTQTKLYLVDNTDVLTLSPWANKRVTADGLVYSPSQLTTENVIYLGKGNILSLEAQSTTRQISISYYSIGANGDMTYINSDVFRINYLKYIGVKYDFARLSFVGSSSDPPLISEFSAHLKHVQYNEFLEKNISFLGDSITTYRNISETSDSVNAPYYPTGDISFPEQCYWKMFSDAVSGGNLSVSAISNSSWRNQGNTSCPSAYENVRITRLSANGTPDYVFINMGTNDPYSSNIGSEIGYTYDVETLEANVVYSSYAIQTTIRKIQVAYPNAKIILLIPKFPSAIGTGSYTFEKWEKLCDYMVQIANMYGVYRIVDMRKCGITVDTMSSDCIGGAMHPNFNGMKKMGAYLINELIN